MPTVRIYSLAYDGQDGTGCRLFVSAQERDTEHRIWLLSYLDGEMRREVAHLTIEQLDDYVRKVDDDVAAIAAEEHDLDLALLKPSLRVVPQS